MNNDLCYNISCLGERIRGVLLLNAVTKHNTFIVGKAPLISGLTSRCSPRQRRQANKGRFIMSKPCEKCGGTKRYKSGNCVTCLLSYMKDRYQQNKETIKEQSKKRQKSNLDKFRVYNRRYREKNLEKERERQRVWYEQNPDKMLAKKQRRRARKIESGGSFTSQQWKDLCRQYGNKCLCCGNESKLTPDHIVPLVKGGTSDISNIQPLCLKCNKRKGIKTTDYRGSYEYRS